MSNKKEIINDYMTNKVKPVFDVLIARILIDMPEDVISWTKQYLDQLSEQNAPKKPSIAHLESEEEEDDEYDAHDLEHKNPKKSTVRAAVSAEAYGEHNKKENFIPRVIPKTEEQKERVKKRMLNSFMFQALEEKELQIVIDAMDEKKFEAGEWVITQGADGAELYVIDEGELDCFKTFHGQTEPKHLKVYHPGESFGELALLYNAPRAASIQAKTSAITFALDRDTFNNIVKQSAITKREKMEHILSNIEILQAMDAYERTQLSDGMKDIRQPAGSIIIHQGEVGDKIYLIAEGQLEAWKQEGTEQVKVYDYKEGDYFGELALLKNTPRQATVKAITDVQLVYCDYATFTRLMGPLAEILKRNMERYGHFLQK